MTAEERASVQRRLHALYVQPRAEDASAALVAALPEEGSNGDSPAAALYAAAAFNNALNLEAVSREIQAEADGEVC